MTTKSSDRGVPPAGAILARFAHPEPPRGPKVPILPVFLPFAGCPGRCVFCDQAGQTGVSPRPLEDIHAELTLRLAELSPTRPMELAFYGGTFTALPSGWPERFLELAAPLQADGRVLRIRCSTRPDAVTPEQLARLKNLGLSLVELGVQSFDDGALAESGRGYSGAQALAGCHMVLEAGLALGVQLMPGLPGQSPTAFRNDVTLAASLVPELVRLYPCLVLENTPLAARWRAGAYAPWELAPAVDEVARALLAFWAAGVPSARTGILEQEGLAVLAGPHHPALGQMARSRALLLHVRERLAPLPRPARRLLLPQRLRGEALGQGNALAAEYAALGLGVDFHTGPDILLLAD